MFMMSDPQTLLELIQVAPGESTAIALPEAGIRVTYNSLREHVTARGRCAGGAS